LFCLFVCLFVCFLSVVMWIKWTLMPDNENTLISQFCLLVMFLPSILRIWDEHDQQVIVFVCIISGNLIQITESRKGKTFGGLTLKSCEVRKEAVRQCFLFSGFLLLTTRSSSGRLHLTKVRSDSRNKELTSIGRGWAKYRGLSVASGSVICRSGRLRQIIDPRDKQITISCDSRVQ